MILDGKLVREEILNKIKEKIKTEALDIKLAIILVGDDEASKIYIKNKEKYCNLVGIKTTKYTFASNTKEDEIIELIQKLNNDASVTGIILQSPVPKQIDFDKVTNLIDPNKDVDGFTKENIYNLYLGRKTILPCTVKGIIKLLEYYNIPIEGQDIVIIGRGNIVGHPLSLALQNKNATVTVLHTHTKDLEKFTKEADILISAAGCAHLVKSYMVKKNTVVIDVGVSRKGDKIVGDVDFENVKDIAVAITPNPGGVGPMTVAMIIDNLVELKERSKNG